MRERQDFIIFQALFRHSSIGMVISNRKGVMEKVNPFAAKIFGYEVDELEGQKVELLLPEEIREEHIVHRERYCGNPSPRVMGKGLDLFALKKDGTRFFVEISLSYYEVNNKLYIVSFINDVSENRKIKEKLKKQAEGLEVVVQERTNELSNALVELNRINDDLKKEVFKRKESEQRVRSAFEKEKELNELKSRFVAMASHEFRTPLGGILSSASLLEKYHESKNLERREKHIKRIKKLVKNLTLILNDFLSLDKLEKGKVEAKPIRFYLKDFILELIEDICAMYQEEDRKVLCDDFDADIECFQDQDMLRNILINLLSNAIKYSEAEHPVRVSLKKVEDQIKISVSDKGIGIPLDEQKHLFERFFRAQNAISIQGTGLGLNIVKRYLDYLNGTIWFESEENKGTTFIVSLPLEASL